MTEEDLSENYEEYMDEAEDDFDDSQDMKESQLDSFAGTYPQGKEQEGLFNWFWKIVRLKKPFQLVKVGNLNFSEIGAHPISVRDAMNLWVLGHTFGHPTFGNYFAQSAKITSATSMSKKGWFMDLSISQKKVRQRAKDGSHSQSENQPWRIYRKNKNQEE